MIDGLWFGALIGALMALLLHALSGGRRDFSAIGGMLANRYEVSSDEEFADEAERLLGKRAVPAARPVSGSARGLTVRALTALRSYIGSETRSIPWGTMMDVWSPRP